MVAAARMANKKQQRPVKSAPQVEPIKESRVIKLNVIGITDALTAFGTMELTVDLRLVPNCSAVVVNNMANEPIQKPVRPLK